MASFDEVLKDCTKLGTKIPTSEYLESGKYPIIDQGQNDIAGYYDSDDGLFEDVPTIVFGDHTRVVKYVDKPCFLGADGVKLLCPLDKDINCKYLFYQLSCADIPNTGYNRHFKWVKALDFKIPSSDEQNHVVEVLDKVTELISLRKQQLAKLDELVKARFVEMFGNPSNNSLGFPYEPLSNCLLSIENGKSFVCSNDMRQEENPAILKLSAVTYGVYQQDENKAILDSSMFVKSAEVHKGDLLFTRKNTPELVGMCAYVNDTAPNLMMPDLIFRLNTNEKINKIFLWKLINHEFFRGKIQNIATGSAKSMSNISKERLEKLAIILPPLHLQNDFAALVERVDQQKQTIQQSLEKLELLKKALMQEYFG